MILEHKETGEKYVVLAGKILTEEDIKRFETNQSIIHIKNLNKEEFLMVVVEYREGLYSRVNQYRIREDV